MSKRVERYTGLTRTEQIALEHSKRIPILSSSSNNSHTTATGLIGVMQYLIAPESHKRKLTRSRMVLLTFLLTFLCTISACRVSGRPSEEQIERAKKTVSEIRASLYTPDGVELLAEKLYHGSNPELYPGCVSGDIYLAYHSSRPFVEILEEYRTGLSQGDWEPDPGYSHNDQNFDVFRSGTQTILSIDSYPIREDILVVPTPVDPNEQDETIYYIQLLYYEPSVRECSEM